MPSSYSLPRATGLWDVQDVERYERLPYWIALQQSKRIPFWARWSKLFGTIAWKPNSGTTVKGLLTEPSPVSTQIHAPQNITAQPRKTVVSHFERENEATVKRHLFESPLFHFLPSFQDFRTRQVNFALTDLTRQIGISDDMFVRWQAFNQCPHLYVAGNATAGERELIPAPHGEATDDFTTTPKTTAIMNAVVAKIGSAKGDLSFREICRARAILRHDLNAPPWEGNPAAPKENETIKGKYLLIGDPEIYENLSFDPHILNYKNDKMDLINDEFMGVISGNIAFYAERYPLRIGANGSMDMQPELEKLEDGQYEVVQGETYKNAPFGVACMLGYLPFETLKIGPPPAEFSKQSMSEQKFSSLNWNGEVKMTDQVLVNYAGSMDTNKYGEYLQLISSVASGIVPNTPRYCMFIIYRRTRFQATD